MKILVTGDRHWSDNRLIKAALVACQEAAHAKGQKLEVVHGDAPGADRIAGRIADKMGAIVHAHPAEWSVYGKPAGPIRNREMLAKHPDIEVVYAFHEDISSSKGTKDMILVAHEKGLPIQLLPNSADLAALLARKRQPSLF